MEITMKHLYAESLIKHNEIESKIESDIILDDVSGKNIYYRNISFITNIKSQIVEQDYSKHGSSTFNQLIKEANVPHNDLSLFNTNVKYNIVYTCPSCENVFSNKITFSKHKRTHIFCQYCKCKFKSLKTLLKHKITCDFMKCMTSNPKVDLIDIGLSNAMRIKYKEAFDAVQNCQNKNITRFVVEPEIVSDDQFTVNIETEYKPQINADEINMNFPLSTFEDVMVKTEPIEDTVSEFNFEEDCNSWSGVVKLEQTDDCNITSLTPDNSEYNIKVCPVLNENNSRDTNGSFLINKSTSEQLPSNSPKLYQFYELGNNPCKCRKSYSALFEQCVCLQVKNPISAIDFTNSNHNKIGMLNKTNNQYSLSESTSYLYHVNEPKNEFSTTETFCNSEFNNDETKLTECNSREKILRTSTKNHGESFHLNEKSDSAKVTVNTKEYNDRKTSTTPSNTTLCDNFKVQNEVYSSSDYEDNPESPRFSRFESEIGERQSRIHPAYSLSLNYFGEEKISLNNQYRSEKHLELNLDKSSVDWVLQNTGSILSKNLNCMTRKRKSFNRETFFPENGTDGVTKSIEVPLNRCDQYKHKKENIHSTEVKYIRFTDKPNLELFLI